jgi:hypothetical protein
LNQAGDYAASLSNHSCYGTNDAGRDTFNKFGQTDPQKERSMNAGAPIPGSPTIRFTYRRARTPKPLIPEPSPRFVFWNVVAGALTVLLAVGYCFAADFTVGDPQNCAADPGCREPNPISLSFLP